MIRAVEHKGYYQVPVDNRDLNYGKYFNEGSFNLLNQDEYHSHNAKRLSIEEIKEKLLTLEEIQSALDHDQR